MEIQIENFHGYTVEPCAFYDNTGNRIYVQMPEGAILGYKDFYSGRVFDNPQSSCYEVVVLFEGAGEIRNSPSEWVIPEGATSIKAHHSIYTPLYNFFFGGELPQEGKPEEWQYSLQLASASSINPMQHIEDQGFNYGPKRDIWMSRFTQNLPENNQYELLVVNGGTGANASDDRIRYRLK